ncbi:MAG: ABC transporter ATP-binding protein [Nitrospirae bacterium]|nr:ABC transporter ATP-binding protein [Nitrospirota bacterium]
MLSVHHLEVFYGGIQALHGATLEVPKGKIVTLIGANGAGKSTLLRAIAGLVPSKRGEIRFEDVPILGRPAYAIARSGLVLIPEGRRIFPNLSVEENLKMATFARPLATQQNGGLEHVFQLFPRLKERARQLGGTLSGGEQQMLALGRALMASPKLLMIDEPSLGLAPKMVTLVFDALLKIHQEGVTLLLVEQNAKLALQDSDYTYVIETGSITLHGPSKDLLDNPRVQEAYLGA